jgi:hypothetical protein
MYEFSNQWTILGSDGTSIVTNDGVSGVWVQEIGGFDSPPVRGAIEVWPVDDGGSVGDAYYGPRPVSLRGKVGVATTAAARNLKVRDFQRASRGLRGDVTLKSTPSGLPAMQVKGRIQEGIRLSGGYVKDWQLLCICPDPRIYSQALNSQETTGASPLLNTITNAGNYETPPILTVTGPATNVQLKNDTTGETLFTTASPGAGVLLVIDFGLTNGQRTSLLAGVDNYSTITYPTSAWWKLAPGSNTIRLTATGTTGATKLKVEWRDAWI